MSKIESVLAYLGEPYTISALDNEPVIYRKLENGYELEVSGVHGNAGTYSLYVWQTAPSRELVGVYHGIRGEQTLKDVLGHCAFRFQNLSAKIQVEREDLPR